MSNTPTPPRRLVLNGKQLKQHLGSVAPAPRPVILDPVKASLHDRIAPHLDAIKRNFMPGCKITLLLRMPGREDHDLVVTDDTIDEIEKIVQRKKIKMQRGQG